jgi:hypothetical protein
MSSENPTTAERHIRDGAPPNDGPLGGLPGPSAETDRDAPSGLPEEAREAQPLGPDETRPEGEGEAPQGEEHMPGIPTGGEPPTAG